MTKKLFIIIVSITALFFSIHTNGQIGNTLPSPKDDYVNDFASVLNQGDAESIRKLFSNLEKQTGVEVVVVTINSIRDYNTTTNTIETFATQLFNQWGVGHKKANNGVMFLIAIKDRQCRIELGKGYGRQYDQIMKQVIDESIIPYFKNNEYSRGIFEGSRAIVEKIIVPVSWFEYYKWHIILAVFIVICVFAGISCIGSGKSGWGWVFFAAVGVLLFFLINLIFSGKRSSGFGGGSSFGGGASGSW
jgi:uncharacterized protein